MKRVLSALSFVSCVALATGQDIETDFDFDTPYTHAQRRLNKERWSQEEKIKESFLAYKDICKKLNMEPRIRPVDQSAEGISKNDPWLGQDPLRCFDSTTYDISVIGEELPWMRAKPSCPNEEEASAFEHFKQEIKKGAILELYSTAAAAGASLSILKKVRCVLGSKFPNLLDSEP